MHKLGYILLRIPLRLLGCLPLGCHYAFSGFLCWLLKDVIRYRRDVVLTNLSRSFPDRKYGEIRQIADRFYRYLSDVIVEAVWFGGCTPKRFQRQKMVLVQNPELIAPLLEHAPGVILLNSHRGNWELFGAFEFFAHPEGTVNPLTAQNTTVVYKRVKSQAWDLFMRRNRLTLTFGDPDGDSYVEHQAFLRFALRNLAAGHVRAYNVTTDQHPYKGSEEVPVGEFMHQPTTTMMGGISLACKKKFAVAYMHYSWVDRGHYTLRFSEICADASTMDPVAIMKQYYSLLQQDIEAQPWNYLWTHKRWK